MSDKSKSTILEDSIKEFLEYLVVERQLSRYTTRNYSQYLSVFSMWVKKHYGDIKLKAIDQKMIRSYRAYIARRLDARGRGLSPVTQGYYAIALRSFLKFLLRNDYDVMSPERIELPKTESRRVKFLDWEMVERMIAQANVEKLAGLRDRVIMEVLFSTGLRVSELVSLDRATVNLDTREFGVRGKGGRVRVVFLSERATEWILRYVRERQDHYDPLFIRHAGAKPAIDDPKAGEKLRLTTRSVQRIIRRYGFAARLPFEVTPHVLRHSFATDLLSSGAGLREVQEMLGHKNIATTQIYTHVTNPQLKKIHERFHSGNERG